ncbi:AMP-binding protein [Actinophytocola gossypii]|uniref:AMP-binding protein n=1 Tax=Actinophytocola gossypii TaxID=2812003 RepID=A0ABT2JB78_9PSEU|nr:AMP-binding protein [Actinophytocola gossypii]MCT2585120.1 AMP-binding protein [Actinophytocola gossypii]
MNETTTVSLSERFLLGLRRAPENEAVRVGTAAISYAEAHRTALRWASALTGHGTRPGPVGVLAGESVTAYVGVLAALYAGATVVPLRPDFPAARTRSMLDAAGVAALVVDDRGHAALPDLPDLPVLAPDRPGSLPVPAEPVLTEPRPVAAEDAAYVLFTSGSTGRPKGVPITHGSLAHYFRLLDERYDFGPDDVFSQTFDLNFDCAMFDLFCAWGAGARLLRVPGGAYRELPAFLAEHRVSVWFSTPSSVSLVRRLGGLTPGALPSLRWSFFAGEALRCQDAEDWQAAAPGSSVENLYGPTELTITVSRHRFTPESTRLAANGVVPIGALHDGHEQLIVGPDGEQAGAEGELWVSGPQLTPGYLDPADGTGRFVERDGRVWYRTGDRVRPAESGELLYLGRLDSQVQVHGWRVELAEIDHALRGCPGVDDAVTLDTTAGGETELVVFYTGERRAPVAFSRALRDVLPLRLVPRHYRHLADLPLNGNRKVDRPALRALAAEVVAG